MEVFTIVELRAIILGKIDCGSDWKQARLVCRVWCKACGNRVAEFSNHLWTLVQKFPDKPWEWFNLSSNPNITWDVVVANPDLHLLITSYLEQNQLPVDSVLGKKLLINVEWNWAQLSMNKFTKTRKPSKQKVLFQAL